MSKKYKLFIEGEFYGVLESCVQKKINGYLLQTECSVKDSTK